MSKGKQISTDVVLSIKYTYIKDEEGVFSRKQRRRAVVGDFGSLFMPPLITAFYKVDWVTSPLQDEYVLYVWAVLNGIVRERLDRNGFAAATTFIGGNDNAGLAVVDTVTKRL